MATLYIVLACIAACVAVWHFLLKSKESHHVNDLHDYSEGRPLSEQVITSDMFKEQLDQESQQLLRELEATYTPQRAAQQQYVYFFILNV